MKNRVFAAFFLCMLTSVVVLSACANNKNTESAETSESKDAMEMSAVSSADENEPVIASADAISSDASADATASSVEPPETAEIPDVESISNEAIPWGYSADRDELNRPVTALEYQKKYADYNVDFIVPTDEKVIYLTFDEGYENGQTASILDTLKEKNATGVFFVTMDYVKKNHDLVERMIKEGHVLGNHTVHHPADGMQSLSIEKQQEEVNVLHDYIRENFGYEMFLFRYPTGMFSEQSLAVVNNCGYKSVFWSFAYVDWITDDQPDTQEAYEKLIGALHPGAIYLLHGVSETNDAILGDFLDAAAQKGYVTGDYLESVLNR